MMTLSTSNLERIEALAGDAGITPDALVERALDAYERDIGHVFDHIDDAVMLLNREWQFVYINPPSERLMGHTLADVQGKVIWQLFPDALGSPFETMYREVMANGTNATRTDYYPPTDRWMEVRVFPADDGISIFSRDVTERYRDEQRVREEHDLLNSIMETSVAAITVVNPAGQITFANQSAERILGLTRDELKQQTYDAPNWKHTAIDGGPWHDEDQPFVRIMTTGEPVDDVRHAIEMPDGEKRYLSINGAPVKNQDGEITNTVFLVTDITDNILAELAVYESEKRLELALLGGQLGMWDWHIDTGRVVFNERWAEMLGYTLDEIEPHIKSWVKLVHPDDMAEVNTVLQSHLDGETPVYMTEHRALHKDGSWIWIQDQGQVVERDDDGNPLRAVGTHLDITARKEAEAALLESEDLYRGLVENQIDLVCRYKPDSTLVFVNDAYCDFFDFDPDAIIGQSFLQLSPQEQIPKIKARLIEVCRDPSPKSMIVYSKPYDGEPRWVQWVDYGITDSTGEVVAIQAVGRDITPMKRAQQALEVSEERFRAIFEQATDGIILFDENGIIRMWNPATEEMSGISAADALDHAIWDVIYQRIITDQHGKHADREMLRQGVQALIDSPLGKQGLSFEYDVYNAANERRTLQARVVRVRIGDEPLIAVFNRDVTGARLLRESLQRSNALLQLLSDVQNRFISEKNPNDLFEQILGGLLDLTQSAFGFIGRVHDAGSDAPYLKTYALSNIAWDEDSRQFYTSHSPNDLEFRNLDTLFGTVMKTGTPVIANDAVNDSRASGTPEGHPPLKTFLGLPIIRDEEMIGMLGIANRQGGYDQETVAYIAPFISTCANIMDAIANEDRRRDAEDRLRRNIARLQLLASIDKAMLKAESPENTANITLSLLQQMETFDRINITLFDFENEKAIMLAQGYPHPITREVPLQRVLQLREQLDRGEMRSVPDMDAMGEITPAERVWYDEGVRAYALIPMVFDARAIGSLNVGSFERGGFDDDRLQFAREITDRLAIAIQQYELYMQTQRYSRELEERISEMEAINAEMERFTYTVSHDLKSPLITIQGFLGMLERDIEGGAVDRVRADVGYIREAAEKMQELLDDLLELSRIGRLVNPSENIPLAEITRDVLLLLDSQITEREVRVVVHDDLPVVYGDKIRLREVVQNLVENAIKFMGDQPDPQIEIGGTGNNFYIKDNGIGIDARYHERIFGLFEQLDQAQAGTGIGLALVKRIIEFHNGSIRVESEGENKGSTFTITFEEQHHHD